MVKKVATKSSDELYGEGPEAWMFMPYYLAIVYKAEKSKKLLGDELEKHYMKQDQQEVTTQYKTGEFNNSLKHEMDAVLSRMNIANTRKMFDEMNACCESVLKKYMEENE
jgi:hypothetical protein